MVLEPAGDTASRLAKRDERTTYSSGRLQGDVQKLMDLAHTEYMQCLANICRALHLSLSLYLCVCDACQSRLELKGLAFC